jgi:hypothetical protein
MILYLIPLLIVLAAVGYWLMLRKGPPREPVAPLRKEKFGQPAVQTPKRTPEFIEELYRREQSMKAGNTATKKSEFDLQELRRKEKEIVVEPPKEHKDW